MSSATTEPLIDGAVADSGEAARLPRLLAGVPAHGAMSLQSHLDVHGDLPPARRRDRRAAAALIEQIAQAGLGGRGGAGFPLARKLESVIAGKGKPIVVVNATEGEPASLKDKTLLQVAPHLVLDGAALLARAIGAEQAILCVCESAGTALQASAQAISERDRLPGSWPRITLAATPADYVAGQESALVNHLNGGEAKPTFTPPYESGVRRQPTLVSNAETLAHAALIARHGARWFRQLGSSEQPGSTLITLNGPIVRPGVYEVEHGASLISLVQAAGGIQTRVRAALLGGYAGTWIGGADLSRLTLDNRHLAQHGATLGAGVLTLLSEQACPVAEVARVTRWLAGRSAGQCGPCMHGLGALADTLEQTLRGGARADSAAARLQQLSQLVARRGACSHPDGTAQFALSAVGVFAEEFADHAEYGPCDACARAPELPLPVPDAGRRTQPPERRSGGRATERNARSAANG